MDAALAAVPPRLRLTDHQAAILQAIDGCAIWLPEWPRRRAWWADHRDAPPPTSTVFALLRRDLIDVKIWRRFAVPVLTEDGREALRRWTTLH